MDPHRLKSVLPNRVYCRSSQAEKIRARIGVCLYPFIHIGPLTLGSYGLMVAIGLICAFFILRADFARRGVSADAEAIIGITGLAGLVGSRLYHLLESPAEFFADPWPQLFSTMGFAFAGAIIGGFIALVILAKRFRMPVLLMLDAASPAAAMGYGIGRIGCLISGDGDYGIPTSLPWGMSFPNGIVPTTEKRSPHPDLRIPGGNFNFLDSVAAWRARLESEGPKRNYFCGVSGAHRNRPVSCRNYPDQSALVLRAHERAGGERGFGYCRRSPLCFLPQGAPANDRRLTVQPCSLTVPVGQASACCLWSLQVRTNPHRLKSVPLVRRHAQCHARSESRFSVQG